MDGCVWVVSQVVAKRMLSACGLRVVVFWLSGCWCGGCVVPHTVIVCLCVRAYVCVYMYVHMCAHVHTCLCMCICVCVHACMRVCVCACVCVCTYMCVCMYMCVCWMLLSNQNFERK